MERRQTPALFNANRATPLTMIVGVLLAIYLGTVIGGGDLRSLVWLGAAGGVVFFLLYLYRYVWQTVLVLFFIGFTYRPAGFAIGATEISCALGIGGALMYAWQKKLVKRPAVLNQTGFPLLLKMLFVWLLYVSFHLFYNIQAPYRPADFDLSGALKSYFGVTVPYFLLFYFALVPTGIIVRRAFFWSVARLCLLGLVLNLGLRLYEIARGTTYLLIPGINAVDDLYALRTVGPLAVLFGCVAFFSQDWQNRRFFQRIAFFALIGLGIFGTLLSGGRASLVVTFFSVCAVLLFRRKAGALVVIAAIGLIFVVMANLFSGWINKEGNPSLQRSLQWVLLEKSQEAEVTIDSSSAWRRELAQRTLAEWRSSARIFWFGRATYSYGTADEVARETEGGYEGLMESAQRRGATHNLITDFLIAYGLIGCILYLLLYLSIIQFLWRLQRRRILSPPTASLVLVCLISAILDFLVALVAGGDFPVELLWCLIVIIAAVHGKYGLTTSDELPSSESTELLAPTSIPAYSE